MPDHPARGKGSRRLDRIQDHTRRQNALGAVEPEIASPKHPVGVIILPVSIPGSASNSGLRLVAARTAKPRICNAPG
jgi:hypothetical protein